MSSNRWGLQTGEHRRVVDEHVDAPEAPERLVDHGADGPRVAHVGPHAEHAVRRAELLGRVERIGDVGDDDARALGEEALGVREADPLGSAGDHGNLVGQTHCSTLRWG